MSINNPYDLSAFEPEAMLASVPGEHPKMAATLGVGRHYEKTGALDVETLSRIANALYTEGFPTRSPLASQKDALDTAAFSTDITQYPQDATPSSTASPQHFASVENFLNPADVATLNVQQLQHAPDAYSQLETFALANSIHAPEQDSLSHLFASTNLQAQSPTLGNKNAQPFYFLAYPSLENIQSQRPEPVIASAHPPFDAHLVRKDFPILRELVNGRPLVWFDNAATTQKPQAVIDRISYFYAHENSNIHRAAHELAARATDAYENARETVRRFINAPSVDNIVFVRGTTEAINLVAKTWGKKHLGQGDEILISHLEHHANIVPWQQLCQETGAKFKVAPVDDSGQVLLEEYQKLLTSRTKLVSFTQVSNALGTVTPAKEMIAMAHHAGAKVLLDGAQSVSHMPTDIQALNPDFFVFSGHKIFGPTGIGVLYGKSDVLEEMPAWQGGGNMIQDVTFEKTVYHKAPAKFEAGTGNIADAVGLGAALEYVERIGIDNIARYEHELLVYATAAMREISGLTLIGTARDKASVLSFALKGYESEQVGAALNAEGIAVRSGHHCAQPILRRFGVETTVRPSLAFYNTYDEIDRMVKVIQQLSTHLSH